MTTQPEHEPATERRHPGKPERTNPHEVITVLREELEKRWEEGQAVGGMLESLAWRLAQSPGVCESTRRMEMLNLVAVVVPASEWDPAVAAPPPLSPAQREWVANMEAAIQATAEQDARDGEETDLMQRSVTGMLASHKSHDLVRTLHQELAERSDEEATTMATRLMRAIQAKATEIEEWESVQAVLVANTGKKGTSWCGEMQSEQEAWVTKWMSRLLKRDLPRGSGRTRGQETATSSTDKPALLEEARLENHLRISKPG